MIKRLFHNFIVICCAVLLIFGMSGRKVHAESAVDKLTVKVGYVGMDYNKYVNAGSWHWSELYDMLPIYQIAYSYFQSGGTSENPSTDQINSKKYNAIVDSANGFLIEDLINEAGIYFDDVRSIGFYVNDHKTIWASFDPQSLFRSRYYFNNLPSHRSETDKGYDFSDAWNDCEEVPPLLAIEDNWASYTEEFESIGPDFSYVNPGSRFHLLFGQESPTQQMTKASAKYVSTIYVTLAGKPEIIVPDDIPLDGKKGAHTTEITAKVDNAAIIKNLTALLNLRSTNEGVLRIKNIRVVPDPDYIDRAKVIIDYEIVGKGKASITGDFAGVGDYSFSTGEVEGEGPSGDGKDSGKKGGKTDGNPNSKNDKNSSGKGSNNSGGNSAGKTSGQSSGRTGTTNSFGSNASLNGNRRAKTQTSKKNRRITGDTKAARSTGVFKLSDNLKNKLEELAKENEIVLPDTEEVTQLKVPDHKKETKKEERRGLLFVGLGSIGVMAFGALAEELVFRKRLNKKAFSHS